MDRETVKTLKKGDRLRLNDQYGYMDNFGKIGDTVTFESYEDYGDRIIAKNKYGKVSNYFSWRFDFESHPIPSHPKLMKLTYEYAKSKLKPGDKLYTNNSYGKGDDFAGVGDVVTFVKALGDEECITVRNIKGVADNFFAYRFDVADVMDVKAQINLAKSYVGKRVSILTKNIVVSNWKLVAMGEPTSTSVQEVADNDGFCVAITDGTFTYPVLSVTPVEEVKVKLNSKYNAIVTKDTITVGCQNFPVSILKDLQSALDSLQ